jgi:hypothetical protein
VRDYQVTVTYRMTGTASGSCPHCHTTIAGAARCAYQYERKSDFDGDYSDRRLVAFDRVASRDPTEDERREFDVTIENLKVERHHPLILPFRR